MKPQRVKFRWNAEGFDEPGDCKTCNGHRWQLWRTKNEEFGSIQPELRACPDCNPEGNDPPPMYRPTRMYLPTEVRA